MLCEVVALSPSHQDQILTAGIQEIHCKGETVGHSKHVGTKLSKHRSFTMSVFQWLNTSCSGCKKETRTQAYYFQTDDSFSHYRPDQPIRERQDIVTSATAATVF